jgi:phospholipid-translocating ATPase
MIQNTMWANTVIASGTVIGVVIYTGSETRAVMNANLPVQKVGQMDAELNNMSKVRHAIRVLYHPRCNCVHIAQ